MKKLLVALILASTAVKADPTALNRDFKDLIARHKLGAASEQTYCYENQNIVNGYQPDKMQRIASVTKLLTTLMASETLNLNQTFKTRIYIGKDRLHIEGFLDPYFEEEKFLLLMKSLNDLGYTRFKQVSFDSNFLFYDLALGDYEVITPEKVRLRMAYYLNAKNKKNINATWKSIQKFASEEDVDISGSAPSLSAGTVILSNVNPLIGENPAIYIHESQPVHKILKSMNVMSKNLVAENLFNLTSKIKTFATLMKEKGVDAKTFSIVNGSGLPVINGKKRFDNLASCRMILKAVSLLSQSLSRHRLVLSDVVAVNGGLDLGSFRDRFEDYPETHEAVLSKTGTLKHTSSLAGMLLIGGEVPFAILNHTTNVASARKFQDAFVARMFDDLGAATPLVYSKISIFPWDGKDFLRLMR